MGSDLLVALIATLGVGGVAVLVRKTLQAARGDPAFWEWEIRRFEGKYRRAMPPSDGIVFTGSSSTRFWKTLEADMAPLPVINRGFGGSQIHQVTHYAGRIVLPYKPKIVVLYAGENDIAGVKFSRKKSAKEVLDAFEHFCEVTHAELPETLIVFVSIKPPKQRAALWAEMQEANRLAEAVASGGPRIQYVDVSTAMLDEHGEPRGGSVPMGWSPYETRGIRDLDIDTQTCA